MYKIGIVGSGPEHLMEHDKIQRTAGRIIDHLGCQYGENDVVFGVEAKIGMGLWAADECIVRDYKYHLFLPYDLDTTYEHWYDEQKDTLKNQYNKAHSLTICNQDNAYRPLIDTSRFVVVFWAGNKNSNTCEAIKYALEHNKIVLDGLHGLQLMTNKDVRKSVKSWKKK